MKGENEMEESVLEDLGIQLGEKAIDLAKWRSHAESLQAQLDQANERIAQLSALATTLSAQVGEQMIGPDDVEEGQSPPKE